jgi:hypothetical protein
MTSRKKNIGTFILFSLFGALNIYHWYAGRSNQYSLYFGIAFGVYAAYCLLWALKPLPLTHRSSGSPSAPAELKR